MLNGPDDPRHGTVNGYNNHRCRCDRCREAQRIYINDYNHRTGRHRPRVQYLAEDFPIQHGTETGYNRCRCDECKAAAAAARQRRRAADREATRAYWRDYYHRRGADLRRKRKAVA
jgi:hypothetical protein